MYCPKCAGQNGDDAKFCRVCGSDLSMIAQAMTGKIRSAKTDSIAGCDSQAPKPQRLQKSITSGFMGLGFVVVGLSLMLSGESWGVYMLIPGFLFIGQGVSAFVTTRMSQAESSQSESRNSARATDSGRRGFGTGDLVPPANSFGSGNGYGNALNAPPPSVTEGTTKIIDPAIQARDRN